MSYHDAARLAAERVMNRRIAQQYPRVPLWLQIQGPTLLALAIVLAYCFGAFGG